MRAVIQRVSSGSVFIENKDVKNPSVYQLGEKKEYIKRIKTKSGRYIYAEKHVIKNPRISAVANFIKKGLVVLIGVEKGDDIKDAAYIADKIINVRIFEDKNGKMNFSLKDINAQILLISQFTLLGDARKGRRPDFMSAAASDEAYKLYKILYDDLKGKGICVRKGIFGAHMKVDIHNDGPVTILLDSKKIF